MNIPESLTECLAPLYTFAKTRGVELYLVGGSVRDLLLNRPTADLDFVLASDAIPFAKAFAAHAGGTFVRLDERPPTARVVLKARTLSLDFAQFRAASLIEDLRLRDLTINAIAVPLETIWGDARLQSAPTGSTGEYARLQSAPTGNNVARGPVPRERRRRGTGPRPTEPGHLSSAAGNNVARGPVPRERRRRGIGPRPTEPVHLSSIAGNNVARGPVPREPVVFIDPCGGMADLTARQLRFPSEQVIHDDALRLIRIYRFAAQLGFEISDDSIAFIKKHHKLLPRSSPERIRDELMKILKVEKAGPYLQEMWQVGLLTQIVPIASENPFTAPTVLRGPVSREPAPVPVSRGPVPRDAAATPVSRGPVPRDAATTSVARGPVPREPAPVPVSRGPVPRDAWHALETFETTPLRDYPTETDAYLNTELGWEVNRCSLLKLCLLLRGELGDVAKRLKLSRKASQFLKCLASEHQLLAAERLTRREIIRFLRRTASDWLGALLFASALHGIPDARITQIVDTYSQHFLPILKQGRLITGEELMQRFNLKEGREIGYLLREIEERQFDGEIRTREEAFATVETIIGGCDFL